MHAIIFRGCSNYAGKTLGKHDSFHIQVGIFITYGCDDIFFWNWEKKTCKFSYFKFYINRTVISVIL